MHSAPDPDTSDHGPTWEVAHLFPIQGEWTENDFFALHGNRMIELVDGTLQVLPMPTWLHQLIVKFLIRELETATNNTGVVLAAPLPVRLFEKTVREPDVMYFAPGSEPIDLRGYPTKLDLAMEVVSEGVESRRRDYEDKRRDYERAGIREYWIVDPDERRITVLVLDGDAYRVHGEFTSAQFASGVLIPTLTISVEDVLRLGI